LPVFEQDVTHVDDETAGRIGGGQDSVELLEQAGAKLLLLALGSLDWASAAHAQPLSLQRFR
jgi:hypothetical protein